ncbi:MAG: hypothetical protein WBA29_03645 [Xanthobacteraceae bacterium]
MRIPDTRQRPVVRELILRSESRLHTAALVGAFAVIAAVLLGTLTYRPF